MTYKFKFKDEMSHQSAHIHHLYQSDFEVNLILLTFAGNCKENYFCTLVFAPDIFY